MRLNSHPWGWDASEPLKRNAGWTELLRGCSCMCSLNPLRLHMREPLVHFAQSRAPNAHLQPRFPSPYLCSFKTPLLSYMAGPLFTPGQKIKNIAPDWTEAMRTCQRNFSSLANYLKFAACLLLIQSMLSWWSRLFTAADSYFLSRMRQKVLWLLSWAPPFSLKLYYSPAITDGKLYPTQVVTKIAAYF